MHRERRASSRGGRDFWVAAFMTMVGGSFLASPIATPAQQAGKVPRVDYLSVAPHQRAQALVILSARSVFLNLNRRADLALQHRLPAICAFPQFAEVGGMMGYGPNVTDLFRQAATYVDRILKGARSADLPIQRPTVFRLAVNLKTAKALGTTTVPAFLARADTVIQ